MTTRIERNHLFNKSHTLNEKKYSSTQNNRFSDVTKSNGLLKKTRLKIKGMFGNYFSTYFLFSKTIFYF